VYILQHTYLYHCSDGKNPIFGIFDIFQIFHARIAPIDIFEISQKRVIFGDSGYFERFGAILLYFDHFWPFFLTYMDLVYGYTYFDNCQKHNKTLYSYQNNHKKWVVGRYGGINALYRVFRFTDTYLAIFGPHKKKNIYIYRQN